MKRKSCHGIKKAPAVTSNPTGKVMSGAGGLVGRAVNPREKPYSKKGNP